MTIIIIDAQYWAHAAQAVAPTLTRADGFPIGAVHGFAKRLLQFLLRPPTPFDHVAVVFDSPGQNWRYDILPTYKANRATSRQGTSAGALTRQLPLIHAAAEALGARVVMQPGQEADDIVATLARHARLSESDVVIVSADKDLLQLVRSPSVRLYDTHPDPRHRPRGWQAEDAIYARFGVHPHQIPDYLALVGDAADNIPGVPGVGPKRAQALLREHGDVENAIGGQHIAYATEESTASLMNAKRVATLSPFVQLDEAFDLDRFVWRFDRARALAMCDEHGLRQVRTMIESEWPASGHTAREALEGVEL